MGPSLLAACNDLDFEDDLNEAFVWLRYVLGKSESWAKRVLK